MQPIPLLQDEPQDYPHGGDVVRPFSVVTSERRDSEAAIVWLECFWWSFFRGQGQYQNTIQMGQNGPIFFFHTSADLKPVKGKEQCLS